MKSNTRDYVAVLFLVLGLTSGVLLTSVYSKPSSNNSGASNQSTSGNTSSQGIGSAEELSQALGNNSEMLTNKTSIGNSNATLSEKMSVESNTTGNQINPSLR
jgi:hypothetical protein